MGESGSKALAPGEACCSVHGQLQPALAAGSLLRCCGFLQHRFPGSCGSPALPGRCA